MTAYPSQLRTFPFQAQRQRTVDFSILRVALLLFGTVCWLGLYGLLIQRLWQGVAIEEQLTLSMIAVVVPLGVILAVAWWSLWQQSRSSGMFGGWPALNLNELLQLAPAQFEEYVTQRIFIRRGFKASNTPAVKNAAVKNNGVDIELIDRYGQKAVVQCKRYRNVVAEETVRELVETMKREAAIHAYLVTTARFSQTAQQWAADKNIELIDGERLVALGK